MAKKIGTHSGSFHADEALACYLLRQTDEFRGGEIVRSRDPEVWATLPILVDVGGEYIPEKGRFDHHQRGFFETFSPNHKTKLSSAGLIYKHFGQEVLSNLLNIPRGDQVLGLLHTKMYENFVEALDGNDNGISQYDTTAPPRFKSNTSLPARVNMLNPWWNQENVDMMERFERAVALTGEEFAGNAEFLFRSWLPAREIVERAMKERFNVHPSGKIILFEKSCPWTEHMFDLEEEMGLKEEEKPLYALFPDTMGPTISWRVRAIPPTAASFENRKSLPAEWRGLRDEELSSVAGVEGCVFVHISGFIGGNKTKEGALEMAKKSL